MATVKEFECNEEFINVQKRGNTLFWFLENWSLRLWIKWNIWFGTTTPLC